MDRIAKWGICGFAIFVIIAVALILIFIGKEALPLFSAPTSKEKVILQMPVLEDKTQLLTWSVDEFQTYSYGLANNGHLYFISNQNGSVQHDMPIHDFLSNKPVCAWVSPGGDQSIIATRDGRLKVITTSFKLSFDRDEKQVLEPSFKESPLLEVGSKNGGVKILEIGKVVGSINLASESLALAIHCKDGRLFAGKYHFLEKNLELIEIKTPVNGKITGFVVDDDARYLTLSTDQNLLYRWNLEGSVEQPVQVIHPSSHGSYVTALDALIGNSTYILGYADGSVEAWSGVHSGAEDQDLNLVKIREFDPHHSAVVKIAPSSVNRGFWTYDDAGILKMHFNPSARKLYTFKTGRPIDGVAANNHLNGISVLTRDGKICQWELHNPHPDVSWGMLFGEIWYEGYKHPEYIWQSSGGGDNFEAKYSLIPLALGTFKGAFFGLIFAVPIGVMAALYASQLMQPRIRTIVKPTIEIMAALPSVVIGFLAGLWIAPFLEAHLVAFILGLPIFICLILPSASIYYQIPRRQRARIPQEVEMGIILMIIILALAAAHFLAGPVEALCFHGNIQQWIYDATGQKVEQRNSLVIGLAMGFAVIPIIFSISEDAMSNVPRHYVSGSLALGATRWQSALRVVMPTASPGIFSAIMLGFGRAIGETMILLMATGNTPILSLSPWNGMRTLSANIAVEIPEAPYQGSLYRILFLTAALLFLLTFIFNSLAEIIRLRLREKYRAL